MSNTTLTPVSCGLDTEPKTSYDVFFNFGVKGYNSAGCITNIRYSGAASTRNTGLTWDGRYKLAAVSTNGTQCERNGYDAIGRRVWTWNGSQTNWLVYDGPHVVAEVNATGALQRAYVYGPGTDNLLAMTIHTGATLQSYFYLTDHLRSVHAITDSSGAIVESYRYDAWGRVLGVYDGNNNPLTESAIGNHYLWQGREYSWNTRLYHFRSRWYDPITGRWLSNDPIGISGGLNQYVFCSDNPINFVDPFGLTSYVITFEPNSLGIPHTATFIDDSQGTTVYSFSPTTTPNLMVYNSMSDYLNTRNPKQGIRVDKLSSDVNDAALRAFYESQRKAKYNHPDLCSSQAAKGIAKATANSDMPFDGSDSGYQIPTKLLKALEDMGFVDKSKGIVGWDAVKKAFVK